MDGKRALTVQLAAAVKAALRAADTEQGRAQLPVEIVHNVCCVLEAAFMHGLKDGFVARRLSKYPEPNFWPFVEKFAHRSVAQQIRKLNLIKTDVGRSRVWIRIALNEGVLEHYVRAFLRDKGTVRAFYYRHAFLRDTEQVEILCNYLKGLSRVNVNAPLNSSMLNDWTPTPLQFAGYVTSGGGESASGVAVVGGRQRLGSIAQMEDIPELSGDEDASADVAVSALEFDGLEQRPEGDEAAAALRQHGTAMLCPAVAVGTPTRLRVDSATNIGSPCTNGRRSSRSMATATSDDDNGSTVSHMSLMDARYRQLVRTLADDVHSHHSDVTSTPSDTSDDLLSGGAEQVRVKRNRRGGPRRGGSGGGRRAHVSLAATVPTQPRVIANGGPAADGDGEGEPRSLADELAEATMLEAIDKAGGVQSNTRADVSTDSGTVVDHSEEGDTLTAQAEPSSTTVVAPASAEASPERDTSSDPTSKCTTSTTSSFERNEAVADLTDCLVDETHRRLEHNDDTNATSENHTAAEHNGAAQSREASPWPERSFSPAGNSLQNRTWSESEQQQQHDGSSAASSSLTLAAAGSLPTSAGEQLQQADFVTSLRTALQERDDSDARWLATSVADGLSSALGGDGGAWADALNETTEIATAAADGHRHTASFGDGAQHSALRRGSADSGSGPSDFDIVHHAEADRAATEWQAANEWRLKLLASLPTERGLYAQRFKCPTCHRNIGAGVFAQYRRCAMDGQYYCHECHRDDAAVLPALLVHNWDGRPATVCRASRAFLEHVADRPLIRIDAANPSLYEHSKPMHEAKMLRERLSLTAMYLLTCKETVADDLRKRLWPKEYLFEDIHVYSLNDLVGAVSGALQRHVQAVLNFATGHVAACRLCAQKGFICEICNHTQVIYPFQTDTTHRCDKCYSVYHLSCVRDRPCPKCERRESYQRQRAAAASAAAAAGLCGDDPLGFDDQ